MKALVTGGAGFIGSHIVDRLLDDGHEVTVFDDFSTGKNENLPDHDRLVVIEGDIRDYDALLNNMVGVEHVFHQAAIASVPKTIDDPIGSNAVNYQGTLHVLEAARNSGVQKVVFASSAAVYGDEPTLPKVETMLPVTLSPYAVDKLASEHACRIYHQLYGLETVCLRYFNVFGPRQDPSSPYSGVISIFADRLDQGLTPTVYGDGEQTRDYIFVSDVVEANMKAIANSAATGEVFNIATGNKTTLNQLLKTMCDLKGVDVAADYQQMRQGDIKDSYANVDKAAALLEWKADIELNQGLQNLFQQ